MGNNDPISNKDIYDLVQNLIENNKELQKQNQTTKEELKQEIRNFNREIINKIDELKKENIELKKDNASLRKRLLISERKLNKYNLLIYGIPENESQENESDIIINLFNEKLNVNCSYRDLRDIYRIGRRLTEKTRPIRIELSNYNTKTQILANTRKLKGTGINITQEYVKEDYEKRKVLVKHLKKAKEDNCEATIKGNTLLINGKKFTYDELEKEDIQKKNQSRKNTEDDKEDLYSDPDQDNTRSVATNPHSEHKNTWCETESGHKKQKGQKTHNDNFLKRSNRIRTRLGS